MKKAELHGIIAGLSPAIREFVGVVVAPLVARIEALEAGSMAATALPKLPKFKPGEEP